LLIFFYPQGDGAVLALAGRRRQLALPLLPGKRRGKEEVLKSSKFRKL